MAAGAGPAGGAGGSRPGGLRADADGRQFDAALALEHVLAGLSLSPSVNVAKNMKGRPVADAITALGEPSTKRAVGNTMELVWSDYQTAPYTEWVSTGSSQQVVGMIPATATTAATPVFQQSNSGYYGNRTKVYECKVVMRMQNSIIIDSQVDGNVCPEFINALRKWAGEREASNYRK